MSLKLFFLRHGQTPYSRENQFCGDLDPELTEKGQQMAVEMGKAYQHIPWTAVYVSPKKRTLATAKPLCDAVNLDPQIRENLTELRFGKWEGETVEAVRQTYGEDYVRWLTEPAWNPPTGGETAVQVASRAALVITEITERYSSGNVLIVSHKTTIRVVLCSLLGIDLGRYRDRLAMPVASISVVQFSEHGPLLERLGDRAHLSEQLRSLPGT